MTKEDIYDAEVYPLMAQILAICKAHQIAMVASFAIPNAEDPDLLCTSALTEDGYGLGESMDALRDCVKVLQHGYVAVRMPVFALTVASREPTS